MRVAFTYFPLFVNWNHGSAVLSAHCNAAGIDTMIVPMGLRWRQQLDEFKPDWVCFSFVTVHDYMMARPFIESAPWPKLAGGVYARKGGEILGGFDHVCRGEGERLPRFLLDGDRSLFEDQLFDENIDIMPDYSGVTGGEFHRNQPFLAGKKIVPYSHSRGCPYRCAFCEVRNLPIRVRVKSSVRADLDVLANRFDPDLFYFTDELLPYYMRGWRRQFSGNRHRFICMIRADIRPEWLHFLIDNGLYGCAFGIESGDERFRNESLRKGVTDSQIFDTVAILNEMGIHYVPFYIDGAPGETEAARAMTSKMRDMVGGLPMTYVYEELSVR